MERNDIKRNTRKIWNKSTIIQLQGKKGMSNEEAVETEIKLGKKYDKR